MVKPVQLKEVRNLHEGIKYHAVKKGYEPGCYQLHTPYECRLKFPQTNQPIHKCEVRQKEYIKTPIATGGWREQLLPNKSANYYPAVMHIDEYERLKGQAKKLTAEEIIKAMKDQEAAVQQAARESEARKQALKDKLKPQPGAVVSSTKSDIEGPDQTAHTISRAEILVADSMLGPRLAESLILASKCHAIRDAQCLEKELIKRELTKEERRLDTIMEENRQSAIKRADAEEARRHDLRLQNLSALKEQISAHETAKIMEAERIEEESIRVNQANIATQIDEVKKLKEKFDQRAKLKEMLDQGSSEVLYYKQLQMEEDRITDVRIKEFIRAKNERDARNKAQADAVNAAKQKGIAHIAKAQKAEQELKNELERIRNLKIQEDVEREYRRKERDTAIRKHKAMKELHLARVAQINDIHRVIAREIVKDEQNFNNEIRQNEEFLRRERAAKEKRDAAIEKHRQEISKQINDKERQRMEVRARVTNEGVAMRLEQEQQRKYEQMIIKTKVAQMREQKIPEKYVTEVEQTLAKVGWKG